MPPVRASSAIEPPEQTPRQGRGGLFAFVRPARRRGLRIEIEQGGFHASQFGGHSQMDADGRFTRTTFLADNGDCFHVCTFVRCTVCDHTCKHQNDQAQKQGRGSNAALTSIPATGQRCRSTSGYEPLRLLGFGSCSSGDQTDKFDLVYFTAKSQIPLL
jgi:hypothetical protein